MTGDYLDVPPHLRAPKSAVVKQLQLQAATMLKSNINVIDREIVDNSGYVGFDTVEQDEDFLSRQSLPSIIDVAPIVFGGATTHSLKRARTPFGDGPILQKLYEANKSLVDAQWGWSQLGRVVDVPASGAYPGLLVPQSAEISYQGGVGDLGSWENEVINGDNSDTLSKGAGGPAPTYSNSRLSSHGMEILSSRWNPITQWGNEWKPGLGYGREQ